MALVLSTATAWAFDDAAQFFPQPMTPHAATLQASSEGLYFTGAPRYTGLTCAKCHIDGPQQIAIKLGADPADLFTTGYQPGQTYELEVELLDEVEGLQYSDQTCTEPPGPGQMRNYVQCNNNNFALEADTLSGPMSGMGVFCAAQPQNGTCPAPSPPNDETLVAPDGDAVFGNRTHSTASGMGFVVTRNDPTRWHFWWTAPPQSTGPVTFYIAAVDGNGGSGDPTNDQDPYNDDTVSASIPVREAGTLPPPGAVAGCELAGRAAPVGLGMLLLLTLGLALRRRSA